jgi:hypothetical protein
VANVSVSAADGPFERAAAWAERRPEAALAAVLGLYLVIWTVLPILTCPNLQLDLAEDLALGKEWQLGYWKHPPLPWWLADLAWRLVPDVRVVYLLGPLSAVVAMYVVWRLAREAVDPVTALIAVLALQGLHYFNFSVPKFAHDHTLLFLWPLTAWFFYRGLVRGGLLDWTLAGISLALCFWSKYAAFAFAATLGLFLLLDRDARRAWRTPGPYLMGAIFLIVLAPHLWWLVESGFQPFRYVEARAVVATRWYQYLTFPLQWIAGQALALAPAAGLLAVAVGWAKARDFYVPAWAKSRARRARVASTEPAILPTLPPASNQAALARRYVTAIAFGPFLVTTVAALALGRLPIAMWGFALWSFAPLAALMWFNAAPARLPAFARPFVLWFVAVPVAYVATEALEPLVRDRPKATQFPGRLLAETITRQWRERTGTPLIYVGGVEGVGTGPGEFAANNVAVYSPDRPHVIVHGNPNKSAWIDMGDVRRRGAVLVWQPPPGHSGLPDNVRTLFPQAELQPPLVLPRQTLLVRQPVTVLYAFVMPSG